MNTNRLPNDPATFVEVFQQGWSLTKPDAFLDFFAPYLHHDIVSVQPLFPETHGREAFAKLFREVFELIQDFVLIVDAWAANANEVFIACDCAGILGSTPVRFRVCDRFALRDGLIIRRESYFDPSTLIATLT